jgi:hypothetical protein
MKKEAGLIDTLAESQHRAVLAPAAFRWQVRSSLLVLN